MELRRTLTARDVAVITVGTVIGSGIFLSPGGVMRSAGSPAMALGIWALGGALSLLGALSYAELGCSRRGTGGLYAYLRDALGPATAFTFGWTLFVVIASGSVATLAVAAGDNLAAVMPVGEVGKKAVGVVIIGALAALNARGTRTSANVLTVATALKVGALAVLIVALPLFAPAAAPAATTTPAPDATATGGGLSGALVAMVSVLWAYEGWQYATYVGGEVIEPQRNFPRGLVLGTAALVVIYVLANVGYLAALGPAGVARSSAVASEAASAAFGPWAGRLIAVPVLVSIMSAAHGLMLTASRVLHAMAQDGVFFRRLGTVHPVHGTPALAVWALAGWSVVLTLTGSFTVLLTYVVFVSWIFYGLGGVCVIVFRRRDPEAPRPMQVPGYPVTPVLFVLSAAVIVVNTIVDNPVRGMIGLGATLSALPIYALWRRRAA